MSQSSITNYFKSTSKILSQKSPDIMEKKIRKRNLSLTKVKTPIKLNKTEPQSSHMSKNQENSLMETQMLNLSQSTSDSSQTTIIYQLTPSTPSSQSSNSLNSTLQSPRTREKFYSPTKNRSVKKRLSMKRNLNDAFNRNNQHNTESKEFIKACENVNDKTIFLLQIINKFNSMESLRCLLKEDYQKLLSHSFDVVKPGMTLVCRLFWRQRAWYRITKIKSILEKEKSGVDDTSMYNMFNSLLQHGFIEFSMNDNSLLTFEDLVQVLNSDELKKICKDLKIKIRNKQDAIEALRKFSGSKSNIINYFSNNNHDNAHRVLKIMSQTAGPLYRLTDVALESLKQLHVLMYLGVNSSYLRERKLELMLINFKNKTETFPVDQSIVIDNAQVVFDNSIQFQSYFSAYTQYEEYLNKKSKPYLKEAALNELSVIIRETYKKYKEIGEEEMKRAYTLPDWLRRFTSSAIYIKLLSDGIQHLKRTDCDLALDILTMLIAQNAFSQHKKAEWYAEKALLLHTYMRTEDKSCDEAAKVLIAGFRSDMCEEDKDHLRERAMKIANQKNIIISEHLRNELLALAVKEELLEKNLGGEHVNRHHVDVGRGRKQFETRDGESRTRRSAEQQCIQYYIEKGFTDGEHWEGSLITTIFFLLFWDIVYANIAGLRGLFLSPYQQYPLDMFCESFYTNRKALIDDRLEKIKNSTTQEIIAMMKDVWDKRSLSEMSGVSLGLGWESVAGACSSGGARLAAAACSRLARRYRYAASGFPDLTLWNTYTDKIKFVEVKTDNDKPSVKQRQWLRYLQQHGFDAGFCYIGANTTRNRSRAHASLDNNISSSQ